LIDKEHELAQAIGHHDRVVREFVRVEQAISDKIPPRPRRPRRWLPLLAVLVLVVAVPMAVFAVRPHSVAANPWPNPNNTGVPAGTTLTAWSGGCTITTDNTVIDSKSVDCSGVGALVIEAANVQITKSSILGEVYLETDTAGASGWSFSLTDSEVDAGFQQLPAVGLGNFTLLRDNIHGGETAVQCESGSVAHSGDLSVSCDIRDSYLHGQDIPVGAQWHLGGFLSEGGSNTINIDHNYIACDATVYPPDGGCTGDLNLIAHFGVIQNVTINRNKFFASTNLSFCTLGGISPENPNTNHVVYTNNVFERGTNNICGDFGPVSNYQIGAPGNVWTNNLYEDGATVDPA
jgi:hypothetical protein